MEDSIEAYVVVQRVTKIGLFEYHNDRDNLDQVEIPHLQKCVSLTQYYRIGEIDQVVLDDVPKDLDRLLYNSAKLKNTTYIRKEAEDYTTPCVFDLDNDEKDIPFLYHHMANNPPISSV